MSKRLQRPTARVALILLLAAAYAGYGVRELVVRGSAAASLAPQFDGPPVFIRVGESSVRYAINTTAVILSVGHDFYLTREGEWFRSVAVTGPYQKTDTLPAELLEAGGSRLLTGSPRQQGR